MSKLEGRTVESQFGGNQVMFSAAEGAFYVSEKVGQILGDQFAKLGIRPGQLIEICKAEVGRGPERRTQWIVSTAVPAQDATLAVPRLADPPPPPAPAAAPSDLEQQLAASIRMVEQRKQAAQASQATATPVWANHIVEQTNHLIDAYAQVLKHSMRHEGLVKTDDVRSLFVSVFINMSKNGAKSNAA